MACARYAVSRALLGRIAAPRMAMLQLASRTPTAVLPGARGSENEAEAEEAEEADAAYATFNEAPQAGSQRPPAREGAQDGRRDMGQSESYKERLARTIYLSNLSYNLRNEEIEAEMSKFGEIEFMHRHREKRGTMHLIFKDLEAVEPALKKLNGSFWQGRMVKAAPSLRLPNYPFNSQPQRVIFVKRLPVDPADEELNDLFANFDGLWNIRLNESQVGEHEGSAYLEFNTVEQAQEAMKALVGQQCRGQRLYINFSDRRAQWRDRRAGRSSTRYRRGSSGTFEREADRTMSLKKELEDMDR
ncbi:unnamed protein product [Parascedosporium putredinis]|uniref:RRM domain-containing protein n=1 Tax=Parascedosporium putredinis TaxID=1442378 RepID=A0A9P1H718_9PEZI|nr:unnamed protein product [Parascedosporium putredinis]CAI7999309.1 unnamed protein product [Parascedosporium putredinis]